MSGAADFPEVGAGATDETFTVARNVSTRYVAVAVEVVLGIVILPFNLAHLGQSAYGLWMLTASVTAYFSILDLGYGGALVKFVAQCRARRDAGALNEILSTVFVVFFTFGVVTYLAAVAITIYIGQLFHLTPEQVHTGRLVMLIISLSVAVGTAVSPFGAVINGFQRYDLNNLVGSAAALVIAAVNVVVLLMGYGLVVLVAATTAVRLLSYVVYRANAYRVFPGLQMRFGLFRRERLREVTSLSVYMLLIDWANKLNYSIDALVIGAFLDTSAIAVWIVGQRLAELSQRLTNQLNDVLFPTVVDNDTSDRLHRLRAILIQGTRLSLATVIPIGGAMMLMARPLVEAWVGHGFGVSVVVLQVLSLTVIVRIGAATAGTLLKGAGEHRLVAFANVAAAVVNVAVSIAIVRRLGLVGVALGTLVPVALASLLIIFPAGCRRVEIPLAHGIAEAVWPAVWPAAAMAAFIYATRGFVPVSLFAVGAEMAAACGVYAVVFVAFGLSRDERHFYWAKTSDLLQRAWLPIRVSEGA